MLLQFKIISITCLLCFYQSNHIKFCFFAMAVTSLWDNSVEDRPAALLVIKDIPSIFIPQCLATIASGTVDIPAASAPRMAMPLISAGVSYWGPLKNSRHLHLRECCVLLPSFWQPQCILCIYFCHILKTRTEFIKVRPTERRRTHIA